MPNFIFQHFEAFGGPLFNNFIGELIYQLVTATLGITINPFNAFVFYIIFIIAVTLYTFLKTLSYSDTLSVLVDFEKPWINVITKGILITVIFYVFVKPIPVIQMSPVVFTPAAVCANNSTSSLCSTASGISKNDKMLMGWLVNDYKTTAEVRVNPSTFNPLGFQEIPADGTNPDNQRLTHVPQVMALLGLFEKFYYGFPTIVPDNIVEIETGFNLDTCSDPITAADGSITVEGCPWNTGFIYKDPLLISTIADVATIRNCLTSNALTKHYPYSKDFSYSKNYKARLEINYTDLNTACQELLEDTMLPIVKNSLAYILFGNDPLSTILHDFFEPIDKMFYLLSMASANDVFTYRRNMDIPSTKVDTAYKEFKMAYEGNIKDLIISRAKEINIIDQEIKLIVEGKDKKDNKSIKAIFSALTAPKNTAELRYEFPGTLIKILHDSLNNPTGPKNYEFWRKSTKVEAPTIDREVAAIQGVNYTGTDTLKIQEATALKDLVATNTLDIKAGLRENSPYNITDEDVFDSTRFLSFIYQQATTSLGIRANSNPHTSATSFTILEYQDFSDITNDNQILFNSTNSTAISSINPNASIAIVSTTPAIASIRDMEVGNFKLYSNQAAEFSFKKASENINHMYLQVIKRKFLLNYVKQLQNYLIGLNNEINQERGKCPSTDGSDTSDLAAASCLATFASSNPVLEIELAANPNGLVGPVIGGLYLSRGYSDRQDADWVKQPNDSTNGNFYISARKIQDATPNSSPIIYKSSLSKPLPILNEIFPTVIFTQTNNLTSLSHYDPEVFLQEISPSPEGEFIDFLQLRRNFLNIPISPTVTGFSPADTLKYSLLSGNSDCQGGAGCTLRQKALENFQQGCGVDQTFKSEFALKYNPVGSIVKFSPTLTPATYSVNLKTDYLKYAQHYTLQNSFETSPSKDNALYKSYNSLKYHLIHAINTGNASRDAFKNELELMTLSLYPHLEACVTLSDPVIFNEKFHSRLKSLAQEHFGCTSADTSGACGALNTPRETTSFIKIFFAVVENHYTTMPKLDSIPGEVLNVSNPTLYAAKNKQNLTTDLETTKDNITKNCKLINNNSTYTSHSERQKAFSDSLGFTTTQTVPADPNNANNLDCASFPQPPVTPSTTQTAGSLKVSPISIQEYVIAPDYAGDRDGGFFTVYKALVRLEWAAVSVVLEFLREFQNTVSVSVSDLFFLDKNIYRPEAVIGYYSFPDPHTALLDGINLTTKFQPNGSSVSDPGSALDFFVKKLADLEKMIKENQDLTLTAGGLVAGGAVAGSAGFLAMVTSMPAMVANISALAVLIGLPVLTIIIMTVRLIILAIIVSMLGFFRAAIVLPLHIIVYYTIYDFSQKGPYQWFPQLLKAKPVDTLISSMKLLSGWLISVTAMILLLVVYDKVLYQISHQVAIEHFTNSLFVYGGTAWILPMLVTIFIGGLYYVMIKRVYSFLDDLFLSQVKADPVVVEAANVISGSTKLFKNLKNTGTATNVAKDLPGVK